MKNVIIIKPKEKYISSFCETVDTVAKEGKYLSTDHGFPLEETENFVKNTIEKNIPQLFVIDTFTDLCVGWCDAMPKDEKTGYLGTGLLSEYREIGIGKRLIKDCLELCKNYGYERVVLDVRHSNGRARHVYESLGFVVTGESPKGFIISDNALNEVVIHMGLRL